MAGNRFRIPILATRVLDRLVYEVEIGLEIRTTTRSFARLPFRFDTGTQFTTISLADAQGLGIPFSRNKPVVVRGTTGMGHGYMAPIWFTFPQLPEWLFESYGCFTPVALSRSLLCLTDVVQHFTLRTLRPGRLHPNGSMGLYLRPDHGGSFQ